MNTAMKNLTVSLVLAVFALNTPALDADTHQWNVASGNWYAAGNWYPAALPGSNDTAWIHNGGTAGYHAGDGYTVSTVTVEGTGSGQDSHVQQDGGTLTAMNYVYVGKQSANTGTYQLSGGTLNSPCTRVGYWASGTFTHSAGTHQISSDLTVGDNSSGTGTYTMSGSASLTVNSTVTVGYDGSGTFNQSGGTANNGLGTVYIGRYSGSDGTYNLNGGTLMTQTVDIGYEGTGELNWTGGNLYVGTAVRVHSGGTMTVGQDWSFTRAITIDGGTLDLDTHALTMSSSDALANCTLSAGSLTAGSLNVSSTTSGRQGTFTWTGGNLNVWDIRVHSGGLMKVGFGWLYDGDLTVDGTGEVDFTTLGDYDLAISAQPPYLATFALGGSGELSVYDLIVGYESQGAGQFTQTGGANDVAAGLYVGQETGAEGEYILSGGTLACDLVCVGLDGSGTLTQSGGTQAVSGTVWIAPYAGSSGDLNLSGGSLTAADIDIGAGGTGTFTWSGGTLSASTITVNPGGTLVVEADKTFSGNVYVNGGAIEVASGCTFTVTGEFGETEDGQTITKTGAGTLVIQDGTQSHRTGATLAVNAGKVVFQTDPGAGETPTYNLSVTVADGASVEFESTTQHLAALTLNGTSTATVVANGSRVLLVKALSIAGGASPTATLDLTDNTLIVDYTGAENPTDAIRGYLASGYDGGSWNGTGIMSTNAASVYPMALGYLDNQTEGDSTETVLVKYTFYGDGDLDGVVTVAGDFSGFLDGLNGVGTSWYYGDYDYDGVVTVAGDFALFLDGLNCMEKDSYYGDGDLDGVVDVYDAFSLLLDALNLQR